MKDPKRERDLIVNPTKNTSQVLPRERFKLTISNNQKVMDVLFELLSGSNMRMVENVWEILSYLPVNKQVKSQIEKPQLGQGV